MGERYVVGMNGLQILVFDCGYPDIDIMSDEENKHIVGSVETKEGAEKIAKALNNRLFTREELEDAAFNKNKEQLKRIKTILGREFCQHTE